MSNNRIVIAGATGFLGRELVGHFARADWEVVALVRQMEATLPGARTVVWDGQTPGSWASELEGAAAIINLCGKSVDCRYHARNRRLLVDSRVQPTRALGEGIARCANPPPVWLNASSATIYKHTFGPAHDESGETGATREAKDAFSIEIIRQWEEACFNAPTPATRRVALRTAMVLGHGRNSVFPLLQRLTRLGLGGAMGGGRQYVSWIHARDFVQAVAWILEHSDLSGPVNVAAPNPLPNAEMMRRFRQAQGMPVGLPAPAWLLEIGAFFLRTETELIIKSRRVIPGKLRASGFEFAFPDIGAALEDLRRAARD